MECGPAVCSRDNNGWTPFHKASIYGHLHVVKILLERGADINILGGSGETSSYLASATGKVATVNFLIEHGADTNVKDNDAWNSPHVALQNEHLNVTDTGTPVDIRNWFQSTLFALASGKRKVEVQRGASTDVLNDKQKGPLHQAAPRTNLDRRRHLAPSFLFLT